MDKEEKKKRWREKILVVGLALFFIILTWIEFRLFALTETLPFQQSIFFFGLVNFNIIIFLFMMFLIFRNVVKNFAEREGGPIGSSLKSKLIAAFVGFAVVPTAIMFTISVFYINSSFDRWFNDRMTGVLKSSIEVTSSYYQNAKKKNYHFAREIALALKSAPSRSVIRTQMESLRKKYALDAVEVYPDLFDDREVTVARSEGVPAIPAVSLDFRQKGLVEKIEASLIHHFAEGDLVRVIVPAKIMGRPGGVVVTSYVPLSLISRMDEIASAYENLRDTDPLIYPIKSIYLIILVLMTVLVMLGATWFGFYLARQLSIPLEQLALATQDVIKGEFKPVALSSGSPEINRLITNFNTMTNNLNQTLAQLNEYNRYIEVVLSHVTTGVISVNQSNMITMVNRHAAKLLGVDPQQLVGRRAEEVLAKDYYELVAEMIKDMKLSRAPTIQKEIQLTVKGQPLLLQLVISTLTDEQGRELGKVFVFDDLQLLLSAQRAAAWTEVARRIAHEIKNPLTPISLAAQRLQKKFGHTIQDQAFLDCTKMIVDQVNDLKNLVNEFSQFARMPKTQPIKASLNDVIKEALRLFEAGPLGAHENDKKPHPIRSQLDSNLPLFWFDPDQMKRILNNLVDNAIESIQGRPDGYVKVETIYDSQLKMVRLIVEDNGEGIPKGMKSRIFEPYMTTKKQGTGLGLAIVKRAVEDHNGYIRALDNEPHGTRFVIELPVNEAQSIMKKGENQNDV